MARQLRAEDVVGSGVRSSPGGGGKDDESFVARRASCGVTRATRPQEGSNDEQEATGLAGEAVGPPAQARRRGVPARNGDTGMSTATPPQAARAGYAARIEAHEADLSRYREERDERVARGAPTRTIERVIARLQAENDLLRTWAARAPQR